MIIASIVIAIIVSFLFLWEKNNESYDNAQRNKKRYNFRTKRAGNGPPKM